MIGNRIKTLREKLGLSQEELARRVGYTDRSSVAKVESGDVDIRAGKLKDWAMALGVSVGFLLGESTNNNAALIHQMADVYIACVRDLETQIRDLKAENDSLRVIVQELREANDTYWEEHRHE